jgi:UDP-N-acetylglucosamine 1-carboxyvinyltransferase
VDKLRISGGRPLEGEVRVSGAKNSALPIMCSALLTAKPLRLSGVPRLMDVSTMEKLLRQLGAQVERGTEGQVTIHAERITEPTAAYELVKTMRASVLVLGPLVARCGQAKVSLPGGRACRRWEPPSPSSTVTCMPPRSVCTARAS